MGARNIFFMGTGGASILMLPAAQLLQRRGTMTAYTDISAELITGGHAQLGPQSIVVIPSISGTTKESIELLALCKTKGAMSIALVGHADTPIGNGADHTLINFADDTSACESLYLQGMLVALSILHHRSEIANYPQIVVELQTLPSLLASVKDQFDLVAEKQSEKMADEPWHMMTAAGNCWPQTWYFAMCMIEEMQWIKTRPIHAADFFHGGFELVEKGVSVTIYKGEDAHRSLAERVERFVNQYTDKVFVLDTASVALPGLSPEVRALASPAVLAAAQYRLIEHLALRRGHDLSIRRYYRRVAY
jgi:fructoselysine-6-phosphate deglycase